MKKERSNIRWLYLGAGTLILLFLGLIYAWSIFRTPIAELFPDWTISQLSMTFTISISFFCLGGFAGGIMSKKMRVRARLIISAIMLLVGFFAVSLLNPSRPDMSLVMLYVFYGVFGGGGVGIAYNSVISTVNKWFPDKVGLASGILLMGFGLGGLLLGSVVNSMIGAFGIASVFRMLAIAIAVICSAAALIIKAPEKVDLEAAAGKIEGKTEEIQGTADEAAVNGELAEAQETHEIKGVREVRGVQVAQESCDMSPSEMLKTSRFWFFALWAVLLNSAGLLVINSAANISLAFNGTAVMGMIVSLFNGAGRIIAGNNFDRLGRKISTVINSGFMLFAGVFLTMGGLSGKYIFILLGLIFVGLAYGGCPTITSAYISKAFGAWNYPTNFSIANFSLIPAAIIGPMISSTLLEASNGSYNTNFYAIIGFSLSALIMWVLLNLASDKK
ncbi:MAG: MFS transporter [Mogibacterium sp.]|nr:MFS transporter [Mogibacterium sp.]